MIISLVISRYNHVTATTQTEQAIILPINPQSLKEKLTSRSVGFLFHVEPRRFPRHRR